MSKIPTIEKYLKDKPLGYSDIEVWMREFAKMHVEAALEEVSKIERPLLCKDLYGNNTSTIATFTTSRYEISLDKKQLDNIYPLTNIK